MKKLVLALTILLPLMAFAAEHGESHEAVLDEHAIKTIIYQCINIAILVGGLIYFLKDTVRAFFKEKREVYLAAAEKAQAARRQAEEEHMHIKVQLTKLESTAEETISRARAEAADMRNQMVAEAQAMSKRIREDAEMASRLEVEKARASLRAEMIKEAGRQAEQAIKKEVSSDDHRRLQTDFIQNIEAVRS